MQSKFLCGQRHNGSRKLLQKLTAVFDIMRFVLLFLELSEKYADLNYELWRLKFWFHFGTDLEKL